MYISTRRFWASAAADVPFTAGLVDEYQPIDIFFTFSSGRR